MSNSSLPPISYRSLTLGGASQNKPVETGPEIPGPVDNLLLSRSLEGSGMGDRKIEPIPSSLVCFRSPTCCSKNLVNTLLSTLKVSEEYFLKWKNDYLVDRSRVELNIPFKDLIHQVMYGKVPESAAGTVREFVIFSLIKTNKQGIQTNTQCIIIHEMFDEYVLIDKDFGMSDLEFTHFQRDEEYYNLPKMLLKGEKVTRKILFNESEKVVENDFQVGISYRE